MSKIHLQEIVEGIATMDTLEERLRYRDEIYSATTAKIINDVSDVLSEALNAYTGNIEAINWSSVEFDQSVAGYIRVTGFTTPSPGMTIQIGGQQILLTEANVKLYKKIIKFVLPLGLVEEGDTAQLTSFIADLSAIASVASEAEIEDLLRNYSYTDTEKLTQTQNYYKILDRVTKPSEVLGFSAANLTDEQISKLHLIAPSLAQEDKNKKLN